MRAFVDPDLCIGCTQCAGICPAVFTMEGTLAVALVGEIPGEEVPEMCIRDSRKSMASSTPLSTFSNF